MPREYPLAFFEMSFLLPHFLKEAAASSPCTSRASTTRVDQSRRHVVDRDADGRSQGRASRLPHSDLGETAWFSDYVLPMGMLGAARPS